MTRFLNKEHKWNRNKNHFIGQQNLFSREGEALIQRRCRSSFSKDDEERLLAYMDVTRNLSINYGAAYGFHSAQYALSTSLTAAVDKLAEQLTGDPKFFWSAHHSAGGSPAGLSPRQERELRWRELRRKY